MLRYLRERVVQFLRKLWRNVLVRIHAHEPLSLERVVPNAEIELESVGDPGILHHGSAEAFGNRDGIVGGKRIDDENFIGNLQQALNAPADVLGFVVR